MISKFNVAIILILLLVTNVFANPAKEYATLFGEFDDELIHHYNGLLKEQGSIKDSPVYISILTSVLIENTIMNRQAINLFLLLSVMENKKDRDAVISVFLGVIEEDYMRLYKSWMKGLLSIKKNAKDKSLIDNAGQVYSLIEYQRKHLEYFASQFE